MKRKKPDLAAMERWASTYLVADERRFHSSRGLWNHWADHVEPKEACLGTPRSFANALRKLGFPRVKYHEAVEYDAWRYLGLRKKVHQGCALREPPLENLRDDQVWLAHCHWSEKYG